MRNAVPASVPWEALVASAPIPMGVVSWEGDDARYLDVNAAGAERLGRTIDEVRGRSIRELGLPAEVMGAWAQFFAEAVRTARTVRGEWTVFSPEGSRAFVSAVVPLPSEAGQPPRLGYATLEVTQRKEELLAEMDGERILGRLTAGVLDALEAPLSNLLGLLEVATDDVRTTSEGQLDSELHEAARHLGLAKREGRRLQAHVRELKAFVRQGQPTLRPVDVCRCLSAALRLTASEVKRRCFPMLETAPVPPVRADEGRLIQVLVRVLLECTRALELRSPAPIPLRLWTHARPDSVEVCIAHGAAERSEDADYGACRALLAAYGGTLRTEALPDGGARISVRLPRFAEA
jgi:PAS domain S-box-containing protein